MNTTVVIVTFKSKPIIASCLNSIDSTYPIIIVENSEDINFKEWVESKYPNVKCCLAKKNLGYGVANNFGLKLVKTKYAFIINPDTKLHIDTLNILEKNADKIKDFAMLTPLTEEDFKSHNYGYFNKKEKIKKIDSNILEVDFIRGFSMFLNLSEFKNTGFFDENFFIYLEEIDLCKRLKNKNKKVYVITDHKIIHTGSSSHDPRFSFQLELSRNWHWMWSKFYFNQKHYGYLYGLNKTLKQFISSILKMFLYLILFRKKKFLIYKSRFLGLLNSYLMKKSSYRPYINE